MNSLIIGWERSYQLVDLTNMTAPLCQLPEYPLNITWGPAAMVYDQVAGVVRLCGGYDVQNRCFTFDGIAWKEMKPPNLPHGYRTKSIFSPNYGWNAW